MNLWITASKISSSGRGLRRTGAKPRVDYLRLIVTVAERLERKVCLYPNTEVVDSITGIPHGEWGLMPLLPVPYADICEYPVPREASGLRMDDAPVGMAVLLLFVKETVKKSLHPSTSQDGQGEWGAIWMLSRSMSNE